MTTCFATIVSANYLAYAKVLAQSLAIHAPEAALRVLVVDRPTPRHAEAAAGLGLNITFATELDIPDFEQIAYRYDLVELNTALKPTFLKRLFAQGFERVIYLDPDIQLYAPLTPAQQALDQAQIVLIPHALKPVMDGLRPSDIDYLRTGAYNLGFIGLKAGPDSFALLDWWESRCLEYGFNDPSFGTFVDQKWIDLVPSFFPSVHILRHPGCNVAYWNLHERKVELQQERFKVAGEDLVFFHFSGVRAQDPSVLSKHQTRHRLTRGTALATLVHGYCSALMNAGHATFSVLPYTFGLLDDGTPITQTMRRASCCQDMADRQPFSANSQLQQKLRSAGITSSQLLTKVTAVSTLNFDQASRKVRIANAAIRLLKSIIGIERLHLLLRYAAFLVRESHYASVLLNKPFELQHRERR